MALFDERASPTPEHSWVWKYCVVATPVRQILIDRQIQHQAPTELFFGITPLTCNRDPVPVTQFEAKIPAKAEENDVVFEPTSSK